MAQPKPLMCNLRSLMGLGLVENWGSNLINLGDWILPWGLNLNLKVNLMP